MRPRTVKILAVSYIVKALLIGTAWILVPDLPDRAMAALRTTLGTTTP